MGKNDSINVKFDLKQVDKALDFTCFQIARANELLLSDVKHRVPGKISSAVAQVYNITKSHVLALKAHKIKETGEYTRGRNSGKGNVRFHSGGNFSAMLGASSKSLTFYFTGASNPYWPTKEKGAKPQKRKWKHKEAKEVWAKSPNAYKVTVTTFRKRPVTWQRNDSFRVFTVPFGDGQRKLAMAKTGERKYLVPKTSSVPQAILNPDVVKIWQPQVSALLIKRWNNICKQLRAGRIR